MRAAHSAGALNINFASGQQTPSTSSQCRGTKRFTVIVPLPRNIHKSRLLFNKVPSNRSTGKKHQNKLPSSNSRDTIRFVRHTGHLSDFTRETPTQRNKTKESADRSRDHKHSDIHINRREWVHPEDLLAANLKPHAHSQVPKTICSCDGRWSSACDHRSRHCIDHKRRS